MKDVELNEIFQRYKETTEGPWYVAEEVDGVYAGRKTVVKTKAVETKYGANRIVSVGQMRRHISDKAEANAEFIANAKTDVLKLLEEVDRLKKFEQALKEIANMSVLESNLADAQYTALLALGEV